MKVLLAGDINLDLRDSGDKTVLDVMEDIKTPVSVEITDIIIGERMEHETEARLH